MTDDFDDSDGGNTVLGAKALDLDEPQAKPCVTVLTGSAAGAFMSVPPGVAVIGRSSTAQLRCDDQGVSRNHARIRTDETGRAWVDDLGSSNGTFLNKQRINAEHQLREGDTIQVGFATVLRFVMETLPEAQPDEGDDAYDHATGLRSTAWLERRLAAEIALASRRQLSLSVVVIAPTSLGTGGSDDAAALKAVGTALASALRGESVIARYGQRKLAIVLRACGEEAAAGFVRRMTSTVPPIAYSARGAMVETTLAAGFATWHENQDAAALLGAADAALSTTA